MVPRSVDANRKIRAGFSTNRRRLTSAPRPRSSIRWAKPPSSHGSPGRPPYTAKLGGRPLDLTFKEFELLKYLAQHPGRVFTRQQLLQEVWGYDYFGGTRTVDVHVRRLRAKLGPENESLIGTVRNVGYRFVVPPVDREAASEDASALADEEPVTSD